MFGHVIFMKIMLQSNHISVEKVFVLNTTEREGRDSIKIA